MNLLSFSYHKKHSICIVSLAFVVSAHALIIDDDLFAIIEPGSVAENLSTVNTSLTSTGSSSLSRTFADTSHDAWTQQIFVNASLDLTIVWNFNFGAKTFRNRFADATSIGESVTWDIYDGTGTQIDSQTGTWRFSNSSGLTNTSLWDVDDPTFSNDDGIWGSGSGVLDGNTTSPVLGGLQWGLANIDGADFFTGGSLSYIYVKDGISQNQVTTEATRSLIYIGAVPEPSAYALIFGGLALCFVAMRRRAYYASCKRG